MMDARLPFDDATSKFREWIKREGWSDDILWLTSDRVTGQKNKFWLFRPKEMIDDAATRHFYGATGFVGGFLIERVSGPC